MTLIIVILNIASIFFNGREFYLFRKMKNKYTKNKEELDILHEYLSHKNETMREEFIQNMQELCRIYDKNTNNSDKSNDNSI